MPSNVLAITSYNGMGGSGFDFALLYTPFANNDIGGVAICSDGRFAEISSDRWEEIRKIISDTETIEQASWSRPQEVRVLCHIIRLLTPLYSLSSLARE